MAWEELRMLEKTLPLFKMPGLYTPIMKMAYPLMNLVDLKNTSRYHQTRSKSALYYSREKRILDTISLQKLPDRVPVIGNGINFFPARNAGISYFEYMFDWNKLRYATIKMIEDFDLDMYFMQYLFGIGPLIHYTQTNLYKLPGIDLDKNVSYQYNEMERLNPSEYDEFLQKGIQFVHKPLSPRISNLFGTNSALKQATWETQTMILALKYITFIRSLENEMQLHGGYSIFGTAAFPPFDVMSFVFRGIQGIARDMMKKSIQPKLQELIRRINPWLINLFNSAPNYTRKPGVWFPSERAFSLSVKQFETYYWPTLKEMIIAQVKKGLNHFLTWEGDVTHLVHFLLELPKNISRKCVFNCDTSDIFKVHNILEGHMAIAGNIPLSLMCVGTPEQIEHYCEKLFTELKPGGGFLLSPALGIPDDAKSENVHAMIRYTHKYGRY